MPPELLAYLALTPQQTAWAFTVILIASVIRGFSGFGFSALTVAGLTLILPPAQVIPIVFLLEIAASIHMLPLVWREIDWRRLRYLTLGMLFATPFGIYLLRVLPEAPTRLLVFGLILLASGMLWKGWRMAGEYSARRLGVGVGVISGAVNGASGVGGLPVALFFVSTSTGAAISRASLVAYFFVSDVVAISFSGLNHLVTYELLQRSVVFLPLLFLGIVIGHRGFVKVNPQAFHRFTLALLIGICLLGIARMAFVG